MSPDVTGVIVGCAVVVVLGGIYLWSEGSRRLHAAVERSADRFDVFCDDCAAGVFGAVRGAASEPRLTEREWPRSDAFLAEARAKAAEAETARELIERWAQ